MWIVKSFIVLANSLKYEFQLSEFPFFKVKIQACSSQIFN